MGKSWACAGRVLLLERASPPSPTFTLAATIDRPEQLAVLRPSARGPCLVEFGGALRFSKPRKREGARVSPPAGSQCC